MTPVSISHQATRRCAALALTVLGLAACGGGDPEPDAVRSSLALRRVVAPAQHALYLGVTVPGYPHKVDVYRTAGATRALVLLHGHGGRNWQLAYDLGFNRKLAPQLARNVNWDWLAANGIIAVVPQGQIPPGSTAPVWSNYITDSGQDDVAFLGALAAQVRTQYGVGQVALAGHSNGGAMTARVWCEATPAFDAYFSIAGPMPSSTFPQPAPTCIPLAPAPYAMIVGDLDDKLAQFAPGLVEPTAEQVEAGLTDEVLLSEWGRHRDRSASVCGAEPMLEDRVADAASTRWADCASQQRYVIVQDAQHPIASIEQLAGQRMLPMIVDFLGSAIPAGAIQQR
jgi:poly(3-hydroxybutyrate) depolymerase